MNSDLIELRREAESKGLISEKGIRPAGAPIPRASEETGYYGLPLLKEPQWKWEVPLYLFAGGASGAAAYIGAMADWIGDDYELARDARWLTVGGLGISSALLIADLGRPSRFLAMLRVFKTQSPMSVGAWTLAAFGNFAAASAFAKAVQARLEQPARQSRRQSRASRLRPPRTSLPQLHRRTRWRHGDPRLEQEHLHLADSLRHVGRASRLFLARTRRTQ